MNIVKVHSKANPELVLAIRLGKVIVSRADSADDSQKWYKDETHSSEYKDSEGYPCFGLINKATAQNLKHSVMLSLPVQLTQYDVNVVDGSTLWTQGADLGDGFGAIRMLNTIDLSLNAFESDGSVQDETPIVLSTWNKASKSQIWKIQQDTSNSDSDKRQFVRVYSQADPTLVLSIRNGKVVPSRADPTDDFQSWYKDEKYSNVYKDKSGFPCFSLISKATAHALKHSVQANFPVQLTPYNNEDEVDGSVLWTNAQDWGEGYTAIRMLNNTALNIGTFDGNKNPKTITAGETLVLAEWYTGANQLWLIQNY